jgi:hypothetical protein
MAKTIHQNSGEFERQSPRAVARIQENFRMPHWRCVALIFPHAIAVVSNTRSWRNAGFS